MLCKPFLSLVGLTMALWWSQAAAGENGFVNASAVNLRTQAAMESPVLMKLPYGTPCEVLDTASGWKHVRLLDAPSVYGYVSAVLVSAPPFVASEEDERLIREFKAELFAPDSTADIYRHRVDVAAGRRVSDSPEYEKRARECLERWLYWDVSAPAKYRVWLMDIIERAHTYDDVPVEVLRHARALHMGPKSYVETVETAGTRAIRLPSPSPSFFVATPKHFVVAEARVVHGTFRVEQAQVVFLQALPLIGDEGTPPVHVDRIDGHLAYVSDRAVDLVTLPVDGGTPTLTKATMVFKPSLKRVELEVVGGRGGENSATSAYLLLAPDSILKRIAASPRITLKREVLGEAGGGARTSGRSYTAEFDLDGDGVLDLVQRLEACPADPEDPRDLVNYFNVGERWEPVLFWRTWCKSASG